MASTYSTNLKIELIGTGEQSGTWGTTTNGNLGTALEESIVGYGNPNFSSDANLTISLTDTYTTQTARCFALNVTSGVSLTATRNLVVPTIQKQYLIRNNTTGSQSIVVKTSAGSGITVPNGAYTLVYVDGTNVVSQITQLPSLALATALAATSGGTGQSSYAVGDLLYASTTTALSKLADVATGNALLSGGVGAAPAWGQVGLTTHVTGTLPVANGGTGAATLTANNVLLGNGTSAVQAVAPSTAGNVLTSNGTTWTSAAGAGGNGQVFTASGTFTIPTGITRVKVTVIGAGGGGGGAQQDCCIPSYLGGGAGGGGTAVKWLTNLTPGNTLTVTRGAGGAGGAAVGSGGGSGTGGTGGTSSVSSGTETITSISATGSAGASPYSPSGGGVGSGGDLNVTGGAGLWGASSSLGVSGTGGTTTMGGGAYGVNSGPGVAGQPYGNGGSGGANTGGTSPQAGGAGANGVIFFEW